MLLGNPGILGQGGHMAVHPGIIPGWTGYLGIPGYLDKGGRVYGCTSWDNPKMARLLGNPGILGQGGCTVWVTKKYPFFVKQRPCNEKFAFRFRACSVLHITVFIFAAWAKLF